MSDVLTHIFRSCDSVVLERLTTDRFRLLTSAPAWFLRFMQGAEVGDEFEPKPLFPYLDHFLVDAEAFWQKKSEGRAHCQPWIETDAQGLDWPLAAECVYSGAALLIVKNLGSDYDMVAETMQVARENLLDQERLEAEVLRRTQKIRKREEELVYRLLAATRFRHEETGAHIRRIGRYAEEMARGLGWEERRVHQMRLAAPMHDIGKIAIPDAVLLKPGKLDGDEWSVMQRHTEIGEKMLQDSDISILTMGAEIARAHHERWDGTGYPHGLKGEEIPESARIVSIVDVYDAMVHARVYKPAIPEDEVLVILQEQSGKHFDPKMVEVFMDRLSKMREIRRALPDELPTAGWQERGSAS